MPTITETSRLRLRTFEDHDLDPLWAIFADPQVMQFGPGTRNRDQTREWIEKVQATYRERGFGLWGVIHRETGKLIGSCGLIPQVVDDAPETEVGYRLTPHFWGQGLATEAAVASKQHAFNGLGIERVISIIEPANARSIRVAEKNGMSFEKETVVWERRVRIYAVHRL